MMKLNLDAPARDCLEEVQKAHNENPLNLAGFKLFTITTTGAVSNQVFFHSLGFIPTDIIVTKITAGSVTWGWSSMDKDKLTFTTTAAATIRVLIGSIA